MTSQKTEIKHKRTPLEEAVPLGAPFVVFLDPCGSCNFKCSFCPCNISNYRRKDRHVVLSWELFEKILKDLSEFEGNIKVINLYGFGEPLLNSRLADMVFELKNRQICREVRITTNASLLTPKITHDLIQAGIDLVRVSVEALSDQGYQELCGVSVDFNTILENIQNFYQQSRGTTSKIAAKAVSATFKSQEDVNLFYKTFKPITDFYFIEELDEYWAEFDEMALPTGNVKVESGCYKTMEERKICTYPFTDMVIHSNGIVGACCVDWKFGTQYGDVCQQSLKDIWNGPALYCFRKMHLDRSAYTETFCKGCKRKSYDDIDAVARQIAKRLDNECKPF